MALQTNRTPWTDEITLISWTETKDNEGYETRTEVTDEISCCFSDGVARGEFYESAKAGMRATCSAEVWEDDYDNQTRVSADSRLFNVIRHYPTGRGTVMLILEEVVR